MLLFFQNGHYVKEREYEGVGIVPYDPYHNSSFVVAGNIEEHVLFKDNMQRKLFMEQFFFKIEHVLPKNILTSICIVCYEPRARIFTVYKTIPRSF